MNPTNQTKSRAASKTQPKTSQPLPPDPDRCNGNRARWAEVALKEFQRQTGAELEDALSDLLTNLMHWCDRSGQDFHLELARAGVHYDEETLEETSELYAEEY